MIEAVLIAVLAVMTDLALGDPRSRYHPTAWMGAVIARLAPLARDPSPALERLGGAAVVCAAAGAAIAILLGAAYGLSLMPDGLAYVIVGVAAGAVLLKTTLAIRGMELHAMAVLDSLDAGNLDMARQGLSRIVKRDTSRLDRDHVISGTLESISENTVDGVTGPLFYYGLFGLPGAFAYRAVNTADSMMGYRSETFRNIGWFAAGCDTALNYVPSRLTGAVMVVSAALLQNDWRGSYRTMLRDGRKTASANAGYPMAALAGALQTRLEKVGHYSLGDGQAPLGREHVRAALSMMKLTSLLFLGTVTVPVIAALSLLGWWIHA